MDTQGPQQWGTPAPAWPPSHLELQDEFSLLEGAPVDRHPLIGDTLQVSRSDNIT